MINTNSPEEAKRLLKNESSPKVVLAQDDNFNRRILEYGKFDILLSIQSGKRSDKIRQTDSGLNHVIAKIASSKNIAIGINLEELKKLERKEKAIQLSKIIQNIRVCRKAKTKLAVKSRSIPMAKYFLLSLGTSTKQIKEAIVF